VHDASLTSNPAALGRISNWLSTLVHVAQTAQVAAPAAEKPKRIRTPRRKKTEETGS